MAFQVSPGVNVSEIDISNVIPAVSTTRGAIAGVFRWGKVNDPVLVSSEKDLVNRFGKPSNFNAETFFTAADFLAYSNALYVTRAISSTAYNAGLSSTQVTTETQAQAETGVDFFARYPGALGNSLQISVCPSPDAYSSAITGIDLNVGDTTGTVTDAANLTVGDILRVGTNAIGFQDMEITNIAGTTVTFKTKYTLKENITSSTGTRYWKHFSLVDKAPVDTDSFHLAVVDVNGEFTGRAGEVLEIYADLNDTSTAKSENGSTLYYKNVINNQSNFIWASGSDFTAGATTPTYTTQTGGADGDDEANVSLGDLATAYDTFVSPAEIDVSLIMQGKAAGSDSHKAQLANYVVANIAEVRRDCVFYASPDKADVVETPGNEVDNIVEFRNALTSSSYMFIDSGYKLRYDKYNDVTRYTPLNGDMAGLAARADNDRDPWFSPAGLTRGVIKNVVKLAFNPNKAQRDVLYPNDVNPVITQPGNGTILFGDKTALGRASAFDRVNVRRLFIVLEKAIANASQSTLFEFNDEFTRAQFRNLVEPFLREVQGRRGIYDFRVVCDETNNTAEVIDSNGFAGDIYIKPAKSINFIQLNFIATRSGVEFEELVG